jgi:hypothetical protein
VLPFQSSVAVVMPGSKPPKANAEVVSPAPPPAPCPTFVPETLVQEVPLYVSVLFPAGPAPNIIAAV